MLNSDGKMSQWLTVVNLHAGSSKGERDWPDIKAILLAEGFDLEIVITKKPGDAVAISKEYIEKGYLNILVVGGDGTLNEVVNGIFQQSSFKSTDITLGMITIGVGNDWGRMYNQPQDYKQQVEVLKTRKVFIQDVGVVKYQKKQNRDNRYFVNIAGMGYDALVAHKTNKMKQKGMGGALVYLFNLVQSLFQYQVANLEIKSRGHIIFKGKVFSMSIGICKYNGAGMMQLPNAIADDGLFDVTIIRKMSKMKVIRNIKNLYDGSFVKMKEVEQFRGDEFEIDSKPEHRLFLETDGESLGNSPLSFEIIPQSIKLIIK